MSEPHTRAAVLWTGGKDCCLPLHEALGSGMEVTHLVTFVPEEARFLAHPLSVMELQAQELGLRHVLVQVDEPYEDGYARASERVRDELYVGTIVTGDIDVIAGYESCVRHSAECAGLVVVMPLWRASRRTQGSTPAARTAKFQTFAYAGPMFAWPLEVATGCLVERDGFVFADLIPTTDIKTGLQ